MTRFVPLLLLLTAAAPSPYLGTNYAASLPAPVVIARPPVAANPYQPAPMPNRDLSGPAAVASNEATVAPTLFNSQRQFRGDGYAGSSSEQAAHDRAMHPAAGLNLSMPLNDW